MSERPDVEKHKAYAAVCSRSCAAHSVVQACAHVCNRVQQQLCRTCAYRGHDRVPCAVRVAGHRARIQVRVSFLEMRRVGAADKPQCS